MVIQRHSKDTILYWVEKIVLFAVVTFAFLALFSAFWYRTVYGDLGFDAILYTLLSNNDHTSSDLIFSWMGWVLPATLLLSAGVFFLLAQTRWSIALPFFKGRKLHLSPMKLRVRVIVASVLCASMLISAVRIVKLDTYFINLITLSDVYEKHYQDPKTASISFPEEKRNLIYIYLESMETSYLSQEQGGTLPYNIIPELYTLAQENTNFSHNTDVGGFTAASGTAWTIGAMVGQTAGIPLKTPADIDGNSYGADGIFLPGVTSLTDILHENGYYQTLMVGSDASFGGRREYFTSHGVDRVYDLYTAREDGLIPEDYYVWWGFEDHYLFSYAQQVLTEISQQEQPFAFTMLTVDTHHIGGYPCAYCQNNHEEQYENVMECSSRQVAAFVQWIQAQPFYENTAIIITGDHPSMDNGYFSRVSDDDYQRHVYNCFINSAVTTENTKNRQFCTYDMFPTTLAAMGCTIRGNRLGFGTNLFSAVPTLVEITDGAILEEYAKSSNYYTENFFS